MIRHFLQTVRYLKHSRCGHHIFSLSPAWSVAAVPLAGTEALFFITISLCHFYLRAVQSGMHYLRHGTRGRRRNRLLHARDCTEPHTLICSIGSPSRCLLFSPLNAPDFLAGISPLSPSCWACCFVGRLDPCCTVCLPNLSDRSSIAS